ncbi:MAG: hypothetical protein V1873_07325 [Verrucomicrobiota bacterium]
MKITRTTQLLIHMPDKVGQLARVLDTVSKTGVNVLSCDAYTYNGNACIILVTTNNTKVAKLLRKSGYEVSQEPVVMVTGRDAVGRGAELAKKVAAARINLGGARAAAAGGRYLFFLQAANVKRLAAALKRKK